MATLNLALPLANYKANLPICTDLDNLEFTFDFASTRDNGASADLFLWENNFLRGNDTITDFNPDDDLLDLRNLKSKGYSFKVTATGTETCILFIDSSNNVVENASITLTGSVFDSKEISRALNSDGTFGFKS